MYIRRFLKSSWAAKVAQDAGFSVEAGEKSIYNTYIDDGSDNEIASQSGYMVKATKQELKALGLISSADSLYV